MNQTRKIVEGATLLGILGALMFIDVRFAGFFSTFITLILPVTIIVYAARYTFKDGLIFAITCLLFSFVSGASIVSIEAIVYFPIGIIVGVCYSYGLKKDLDRRKLLAIAIISFIIGEIIATFIIYPLFGIDIESILNSSVDFLVNNQMFEIDGMSPKETLDFVFSRIGVSLELFLIIILILTVIMTGVFEGIIIHILAILLLKRLKIKDLGRVSLYEMKPTKILSYVCFLAVFALFGINSINNQTIKLIIISLSLLALMILLYYGYIFVMLYGQIVLRRNLTIYIILGIFLLLPLFIITLMILGFLYGSGPLRNYIESKVKKYENIK